MRSPMASTAYSAWSVRGQSTVEFALVFAAFLCVVIGLGALWRLFDGGLAVQHALQSASHHLAAVDVGAWGDVLSC